MKELDRRQEGLLVTRPNFTATEARSLTEEVKSDATALQTKLLRLYERNAHTALGYSSWEAYYEAEFGQSGRTGKRLIEAARTVEVLRDTHVPPSQNAARELSPLRDEPDELREAWTEVVEQHGEKPTAAQVRDVVQRHKAPDKPRPEYTLCPTCGHRLRKDQPRPVRGGGNT